jgi:uncharacterized protein YjcR
MAYVSHEINALISIDPKLAKKRIIDVMREAQMHRRAAAKKLGCDYATLHRWIKRLELETTLERLMVKAKREGWFHGRTGGRPVRTKKRVNSIRRRK